MSKTRRPKGPRSVWEPKPPMVQNRLPPDLNRAAPPVAAPSTALPVEVAPELPAAVVEQALEQVLEQTPAMAPVRAEAPAANAEPPAAEIDAPAAEPVVPSAQPAAEAPPAPDDRSGPVDLPRAANANTAAFPGARLGFAPERLDVTEIGATVASYMRGEGAAAMAHLQALSGARTPADFIRLNVGEVQRAADASLSCWAQVIRAATRVVVPR